MLELHVSTLCLQHSGAEAIEWISKTFVDESALLKHELAYCLGQMQDRQAIPTLTAVLKDTQQEPMVRHEAGTAGLLEHAQPTHTQAGVLWS